MVSVFINFARQFDYMSNRMGTSGRAHRVDAQEGLLQVPQGQNLKRVNCPIMGQLINSSVCEQYIPIVVLERIERSQSRKFGDSWSQGHRDNKYVRTNSG